MGQLWHGDSQAKIHKGFFLPKETKVQGNCQEVIIQDFAINMPQKVEDQS